MNRSTWRACLAASCALSLCAALPQAAQADACVQDITDGYGTPGSYPVTVTEFTNPQWVTGRKVTIFSPSGAPGNRPVIFFSHAFGATDRAIYATFINVLVSRGNHVVYTPYNTLATSVRKRYDQLWAGFNTAVTNYAGSLQMDTTRVGFVGHSFGGGATPEMFKRGSLDKGWGSNGRFMMILAPWYVYDVTPAEIASFPANTKALIQVYDDDTTNDHRMAIDDIWNRLTSVTGANKDYVMLTSTSNGSCSLPADHGVPMESDGTYGKLDAYDPWGVWRRADALARCTFAADATGCDLALGNGSSTQTYMGRWQVDGTDVAPMSWMAIPTPSNCGTGESCTYPQGAAPPYN